MRGGLAALLLVSLLAACTAAPSDEVTPATPATTSTGRCQGVAHGEVRGRPPGDGTGRLRDFQAAAAVCDAWWLPAMDSRFVPQGLELAGDLAYVSGYRTAAPGQRACQVVVVDLAEGRQVGRLRRFEAPVHGPEPTYCRHGGGNELTDHGLWVSGGQVLWLLDPDRLVGGGDAVLRAWRLGTDLMGSTVAAHGGRLVIGTFRASGRGRLVWFDLDDVLAPGVDLLARRAAAPGAAVALREELAEPRLQGLTVTGAGPWQVSSRIRCGLLAPPGGRGPADFVPGAEDLEVRGHDVWTVSEASADPYRDDAAGLVPGLLRLDRRALARLGPPTCELE